MGWPTKTEKKLREENGRLKAESARWQTIKREWEKEKRHYGGVHPHAAADVIQRAAEHAQVEGRAPHYLTELRDLLIRLFPPEPAGRVCDCGYCPWCIAN